MHRSGDGCGTARPAQPSPAHVGSRGCSPRVKFYQKSVPVEQGVPSGGWVTGQELSSLEPVQNRGSGGKRNNPVLPVHPSPSHRPAVLDATLGRNARPGQEAAEEALGLSVYPLGNGARAQAG